MERKFCFTTTTSDHKNEQKTEFKTNSETKAKLFAARNTFKIDSVLRIEICEITPHGEMIPMWEKTKKQGIYEKFWRKWKNLQRKPRVRAHDCVNKVLDSLNIFGEDTP